MTDTTTPKPTQAEIEAVAEPTKYDMSIHSNPDAAAWAAFFKATFPDSDEGLMIGWFANAMMAMHDHMRAERDASVALADKSRDDALVEAADIILADNYDDPDSAADAILALRDKTACVTKTAETAPQPGLCDTSEPQPAPAVTVQEAAKDESAATCVGCGQPATGMCWTDCGMSLCGAPICDTCRHIDETHGWTHGPRAIAGGGDE